MKRTNRFWVAVLLLGAIAAGCATTHRESHHARDPREEIGQGTFRIKHDANGAYVAWFWRGSSQPNVEHWITRKNEYVEPAPNNTQKLIFYPVKDGTEQMISSYPTFKKWVMDHGDGKGQTVDMAELGKHYTHTVVTENVNP